MHAYEAVQSVYTGGYPFLVPGINDCSLDVTVACKLVALNMLNMKFLMGAKYS